MEFARAWTGFTNAPKRDNIETQSNGGTTNWVDPMDIYPDRRDPFPKMDLHGGHLGVIPCV